MGASTPCPKDHPLMIAWTAYKATEEFANARRWAAHDHHLYGSLWEMFAAGWFAACARDRSAQHQDAKRLDPEGVEPARREPTRPEDRADGADQSNSGETT